MEDIDETKHICSTYFQLIHILNEEWVLEFLIRQITSFIDYDISAFYISKEKDTAYEAEAIQHLDSCKFDQVIDNILNETPATDESFESKEINSYKDYLEKKKIKSYAYSYDELCLLIKSFLDNSESVKSTSKLLNHLKSLQEKIDQIRLNYGLKMNEIEELMEISYEGKCTNPNAMSTITPAGVKAQNWAFQYDLDCSLLRDRYEYSKILQPKLRRVFEEALTDVIDTPSNIMFSNVKNVELDVYMDRLKSKHDLVKEEQDHVCSSLYDIRDILKCSIICTDVRSTKQIFDKLCKSELFHVIEFNNSFKLDRCGNKDQDQMSLDFSDYADLTLILTTKKGMFDYDEFIEVKLIQYVNMHIMKLKNKVKNFIELEDKYVEYAVENEIVLNSLRNLKQNFDINIANQVMNSRINKSLSVRKELYRFYPDKFASEMSKEELLQNCYSFPSNSYFSAHLRFLQPIISKIKTLSFNFNISSSHYEITFDLKSNLNQYESNLLDKLKNESQVEISADVINVLNKYQFIPEVNKLNNNTHLGEFSMNFVGHINDITNVYADTIHLYTCSNDQYARQWDFHTGECTGILSGHSHFVKQVIGVEGLGVITCSTDGTAKLWDTSTCKCTVTFSGHTGNINKVYYSIQVKNLYTCSSDKTLRKFDMRGNSMIEFKGHTSAVNSFILSPDGDFIFSASDDNTAIRWNCSNAKIIQTYKGHTDRVTEVALSSCANFLYTSSADASVRKWSVNSAKCLKVMNFHSKAINGLIISPDDSRVYSFSDDGNICEFLTQSGECQRAYKGHTAAVVALHLSRHSNFLFSCSKDMSARQWAVHTGECLLVFSGHKDILYHITLSSFEEYLFTCSKDRTAKKYEIMY